MRNFRLFPIIAIATAACSEWELPHSYPVILTEEVTQINGDGADFTAQVVGLGTDATVTRYGFVWGNSPIPTVNSSHVAFSDDLQKGFFTRRIQSDLVDNTEYYVRAFVQTSAQTIYGNSVNFISQGSLPPDITGFAPQSGFEGSEISIYGHNFSSAQQGNIVRVGSQACLVLSACDTALRVLLPFNDLSGEVGDFKIQVTTAGMTASSSSDYSILGPRFRSLSKTSGRVGDLLVLNGEYYDMAQMIDVIFSSSTSSDWWWNRSRIISPQTIECEVPDAPNTISRLGLFSLIDPGIKKFHSQQTFQIVDSWTQISSSTPFGDLSMVRSTVIGDIIYVIGGHAFYAYNTSTQTWTARTACPGAPRYYGTAFAVEGKIYYGFGTDYSVEFNDLWIYDPVQDQWDFLMETPLDARTRIRSSVVGDKVYLGFGTATDLWQFRPAGNHWEKLNVPIEISSAVYATDFTVNGKIYYVGLQHTGYLWQDRVDCWELDPGVQSWTRKSDYPDMIYGEAATAREESGLVFSSNVYNRPNRVYEYNAQKDLWLKRQVLTAGSGDFQFGEYVNGKLFFASGNLWQMSFD